MFYFPIIEGVYPHWLPLLGGDSFIFFRPVFNVADSSITIGVLSLLLFQRKFFQTQNETPVENKQNTKEGISSDPVIENPGKDAL